METDALFGKKSSVDRKIDLRISELNARLASPAFLLTLDIVRCVETA
jgi:hypothetical protein